jgi:hypothetical protein
MGKNSNYKWGRWTAKCFGIAICCPTFAFAVLGQESASIISDSSQAETTTPNIQVTKVESGNAYSVYQVTTQNGVEIRQFVSSDNKVFAVVWQGESSPNLSQLLGKYFNSYESAVPKYKSANLQSIEQSDFIAYVGNSRGYYYGKAIIPSLIPHSLNYISIK